MPETMEWLDEARRDSSLGRTPKREFLPMLAFAEQVERSKVETCLDSPLRLELLEVIAMYCKQVATQHLVELLGEVAELAGKDAVREWLDPDGDEEFGLFNHAMGCANRVRLALRKRGKDAEGLPLRELESIGMLCEMANGAGKKTARRSAKPRRAAKGLSPRS